MQTAAKFDISTLAWIKGEIDETIQAARMALEAFAEAPDQVAELERCREALRQVRAVLQIVELAGASRFANEIELLVQALAEGQASPSEPLLETLMRAILQLPDYLETLQNGAPDSLFHLLPLLNELRAGRGERPLNEASLFQPDLSVDAPALRTAGGDTRAVAAKVRPYYQTALAQLLRGQDTGASLDALRKVVNALDRVAANPALRQCLWVASAFVECLRASAVAPRKELKQLLGKIEQLIKQLVQSGEQRLNEDNVRALTKVLLFHVGKASPRGPKAKQVAEAFRLDDFFQAGGLHGLNTQVKKTVSADVMEELSGIKDILDVFVRGQRTDGANLAPIAERMARLGETLGMLGQERLAGGLREQADVVQRIVSGELEPGDDVLMGIAGSVLAVESTLKDWGAEGIIEQADDAAGQVSSDENSPQAEAEHLRVVRQVMKEAKDDLIRIRELVNLYLEQPAEKERLAELPALFHRIYGSLTLLSYTRVAQVLRACAVFVQKEIVDGSALPVTERMDRFADAVMSVEYYLEAFVESRVHPASVLDVAERALGDLGYSVADIPNAEVEEVELSAPPVENEPLESTAEYAAPAAAHMESTAAGTADEAFDDEIAQVFLEEAEEELVKIHELLPRWEANPSDVAPLQDYRRCFHTLKGSGRLVGAVDLGEFAWAIENMLNRVLDDTVVPSAPMFELLHRAEGVLPALIERFSNGSPVPDQAELLQEAANELSRGGTPNFDRAPQAPAPEETAEPAPAIVAIDPELLEVYSNEAADHLRTIEDFLQLVESGDTSRVSEALVRAVHTLKGSSRIAGVADVANVSAALEKYARAVQAAGEPISDEGRAALREAVALARSMLDHLRNPAMPVPDGSEVVNRAEALYASVKHLEDALTPEIGLAQFDIDVELEETTPPVDDFVDMESAGQDITLSAEGDGSSAVPFEAEAMEIVGTPDERGIAQEASDVGESAGHDDLDLVSDSGDLESLTLIEEAEAALTTEFEPETSACDPQLEAGTGELPSVEVSEAGGEDFFAELPWLNDLVSADAASAEGTAATSDADEAIGFEALLEESTAEPADEPQALPEEPSTVTAEALPASAQGADDQDTELTDLFLEEGAEILDESEETLQAWIAQPDAGDLVEALQRQLHTLKGSARMAGVAAIGDLAHVMESGFEALVEGRLAPSKPLFDALQRAHDRLAHMLDAVRGRRAVESADDLIGELGAAFAGNRTEPSEAAAGATVEYDQELLDLFLEEGGEILDQSEETLQALSASPGDRTLVEALQRQLHTLKGSARMAAVSAVGNLAHALESTFEALYEGRLHSSKQLFDLLQLAHDRLSTQLDQVRRQVAVEEAGDLIGQLQDAGRITATPSEAEQEPADDQADSFDPRLGPAADDLRAAVNNWHERPGEPALLERVSSAVIAIEAVAGEHQISNLRTLAATANELLNEVHDGHVLVSDELFGLLDLIHERVSILVEQYQRHIPLRAVQDLVETVREIIARHGESAGVKALGERDTQVDDDGANRRRGSRIQHEMVRVRRDLMDNLVNFAGEVSIYRSRVDLQINAMHGNLGELDVTVERLREQLRQFDMETEAQIASRYHEAVENTEPHEEFDPLEFDRFTTMQQLSRSMMESLSDIRSLEELMLGFVRESETLLLQQARVNTELQETLMQTRMVQLVENAPRLRRIVRQTAAELGREANLSFPVGAHVEMDRRVVERLIAPLEHMLRNAVAHGIEQPADRTAAGKPAAGSITISMSKEGSEVVLRVADDGRGINVAGVRAKAVERGLMEPSAQLSDQEIMMFICEAGFSTAATLTQIAGRGVGMDVVSNAIRELGGSLEIASDLGRGTRFTVRLPATLSVSRALLVTVGEETFAVPLLSIKGIERLPHAELVKLMEADEPVFSWLGGDYRVLPLGAALGVTTAVVAESSMQPLLLAQSGDHRVALVVDRIIGSREVVIKSLGPQLSTLGSLSGATILSDGSVALVLELPAIIRRGIAKRVRQEEGLEETAAAVGRNPTVMVVDDSITVRAVTKRLLLRHQMTAIAAKDGVDALAQLEETIPDVILLDIEMPRMDGFELATHIRNSDRLRHIPIIMITSRTGEKHRQRALDIGVNLYMGKPYSENELLENIGQLVGRAV